MTSPLSVPALVAFGALTAALAALWARGRVPTPRTVAWRVPLFAIALAAALGGGLLDTRGLIVLLVFGAACRVAHDAPDGGRRGFAHAVMLAMSAGLLLHVLPGFNNPRVLDDVVLSPDSMPYTKYLNFDKGVLGLFLLGLYAPARAVRGDARWQARVFLPRFCVVAAAAMALTVWAGYARWDPKLPSWWPMWLWSMVCLTALPEEAVFRHVLQGGLHGRLGDSVGARTIAVAVSGALFGLAHAGGGWTYVALAAVAGLGYAWIYAATRSLGAAVLAHAGLNLLHLLFFSYPALQRIP